MNLLALRFENIHGRFSMAQNCCSANGLHFQHVKFFSKDRGEINSLMAGQLGSMPQAFLEDLRADTTRGRRGKFRGRIKWKGFGFEPRPARLRGHIITGHIIMTCNVNAAVLLYDFNP